MEDQTEKFSRGSWDEHVCLKNFVCVSEILKEYIKIGF